MYFYENELKILYLFKDLPLIKVEFHLDSVSVLGPTRTQPTVNKLGSHWALGPGY